VLLLAARPLEDARRLSGDPASRTSNVLARLWLRDRLRHEVDAVDAGPDLAARLRRGDPTVAIGDAALSFRGRVHDRVDLGGAWRSWTGLPFVFAVWAGPGAAAVGLREALHACHRTNASRLDEIAVAAAGEDRRKRDTIATYLRHFVRYRVGDRERRGMSTYLAWAAEAGYLRAATEGAHERHA
jgi:chorismate dehydratase